MPQRTPEFFCRDILGLFGTQYGTAQLHTRGPQRNPWVDTRFHKLSWDPLFCSGRVGPLHCIVPFIFSDLLGFVMLRGSSAGGE